MAVGKTPLSVEDILARQKAEKEEASKVYIIFNPCPLILADEIILTTVSF
jgi:hypothetical protein